MGRKKKFELVVLEADFGSSTTAKVETDESGKIISFEDTSTNETNWVWDRWHGVDLVGRNINEVDGMTVFRDEYRHAYISVH